MLKILYEFLAYFVSVSSFFEILLLEKLQVDEVVTFIQQFCKSFKTQNNTSDERGGVKVTKGRDSNTELLKRRD